MVTYLLGEVGVDTERLLEESNVRHVGLRLDEMKCRKRKHEGDGMHNYFASVHELAGSEQTLAPPKSQLTIECCNF
jgi:hypothetical protein